MKTRIGKRELAFLASLLRILEASAAMWSEGH